MTARDTTANQPMQHMYESYNEWKAGRITWDEWIAEVETLLPGLAKEAGVELGPKDEHAIPIEADR